MSTLNVMTSKNIKKTNKIHVPTKSFSNDGGTIGLVFSDDFSSLSIVIKDKETKINLTKAISKEISELLEEGMI